MLFFLEIGFLTDLMVATRSYGVGVLTAGILIKRENTDTETERWCE
jgi:hypothetical protein